LRKVHLSFCTILEPNPEDIIANMSNFYDIVHAYNAC